MQEGGDQTVIVGAASKGIIQRDHQHNAVVYRSYYAANPFENMSEEEVDAYKREVERRERGEEPGKENRTFMHSTGVNPLPITLTEKRELSVKQKSFFCCPNV